MQVTESSRPRGELRIEAKALVLPVHATAFGHGSSRLRARPRPQVRDHRGPVGAVDIRLRCSPTPALGEASVSSSSGVGSRKADRGTVSTGSQPCSPPCTGSATGSGQVSWLCSTAHRAPATGHRERREKACAQFGPEADPTVLNTHEWGAPSEAFIEQPRRSRLVSWISAIRHPGPPSAQGRDRHSPRGWALLVSGRLERIAPDRGAA